MLRIVVFLIAAAVLALGTAWFADRPGEIAITWLGYRIETSVLVGIFAVALLSLFIIVVWSVYRTILMSPDQVSLFFRHRRAVRGYLAISRGLIAVGTGDTRAAQLSAQNAARLAPDDSLTLLLGAQSAQLAGDSASAERAFRAMAALPETKQLGLRGLYIEAQRRNDPDGARLFAEEAAKSAPSSWASQAVLDYRAQSADWAGALETLAGMRKTLARDDYERRRAVLLTAQAITLESGDRDTARERAVEAAKLAPDLVPAAALAGRLLAEYGSPRKAAKILETAWRETPHPDLAMTYGNLRSGDSARERRTRVKRLIDKGPAHIEGALALAQASLEAADFLTARAALKDYLQMPTRRVATLMAEIEEAEGDVGRAREWLARAMRAAPDPAWSADGVVSENWLPVSPVSGRLDAFRWKVPIAEIGVERAPIEPDLPAVIEAAPAVSIAEVKPRPRRARNARTDRSQGAEPVIPLVHAPDDPGPDHLTENDPVPETNVPPPSRGWDKFLQLFR
jgi:HemY protein